VVKCREQALTQACALCSPKFGQSRRRDSSNIRTRRTPLPSSLPLAFGADFHQSPNKQAQWKAFLKKSGLTTNSSLEETIRIIREFVMPVVEGIAEENREKKTWRPGGPWK
jgi:hypothetical protein